ncbi:MAG TPA: hypothetical protein VG368_04245 [Acidimicrobiales bacterium]|nr:hypothetical protein [Acidimicrobiales bacterium]
MPPSTRHRRFAAAFAGLLGISTPILALVATSTPASAVRASAHPCDPGQHVAGSVKFPSASWKVCIGGNITQSSPATLNYEGRTLVAVGDENGELNLFDGATGKELPGWPEKMAAPRGEHAAIESSPSFAFFDGPNKPPAIVSTSGSTWVKNSIGEVEAFHLDGAKRFVFRVGAATGTAVGVVDSPAVGALSGHGRPDILFGSWDHLIYALDGHGRMVPGFPMNNADTIWSSPAIYHLPGATGMDFIIGSDASGFHGCTGGFITDYRYSAGAPHLIWQHCISQVVWSSPAIGNFGNKANPVVVVGTGYYRQPFPASTNKIYAYDARSGTALPGWPVTTSGPVYGSPAIGDLKGDGSSSVVDVSWKCTTGQQKSCFGSNTSTVAAWSASGHQEWSQDLLGPTALGSPILVPLQNSIANDVLVGTPNAMYPLDGTNGNPLFGTNPTNPYASINPGCRVFDTPAVADVVQGVSDLGWHVFEACGGPPTFKFPGEVASYPLPSTPLSAGWSQFHAGADHTGVAAATF